VNRKNTKTISANMGKLSANFASVPVNDWCMSPHGITGPPDQSSRNSGNKFRLDRPLTRPNFVALRQKACGISVVKKMILRKSAKVHTRSPDLSISRLYTISYRYSVATLALDCFVLEISLVLYRKCHFCTYPLRLSPKVWRCSPRIRSMSSILQWARSMG